MTLRFTSDHDAASDNHWCCGLFLRGLLLLTIPKLPLSLTLRPDSARDDHLLLIMTLEPTSDDDTDSETCFHIPNKALGTSSAHSDHDTEAFSRSQHRGLILDAVAEA